ncbi:DUF397 domain-containing protein [Nonomuraea aurantiaca]|jgi:hypothetical protein|uniref:DUF397 domain-containing protein n=1 Tax=Nonomuraea aurantiaca TaxID=2878562 RepID=UPI001CDA17D8|nr:DUF397 domain-containing protein [Nonomuraea aurantiaca]MCA2221673.1 DUF397 domain-containing protein [Nonomuraea aurantiaca]
MDELTRELDTATWRKSTRSGPDGGNCVEVAELSGGRRGVRDSKNPSGPALTFTPGEWSAFISGVKDGEFDL